MESAFILAAVVGATEFLKRVKLKDYFAALTILAAVGVAVLAYVLELAGVTSLEEAVVTALSATGVYTVAAQIGTKNPVVPGTIE